MEDIVLLETSKASSGSKEVFKYKFDDGGEYDMIIYNRQSNTCRLFEIKHSEKIVDRQTRYLRDDERLTLVKQRFGQIEERCVIYRGEGQMVEEIRYINAEVYLCSLKK